MSETHVRTLVIIGSGPAGLTASIYAARANLKPLLIEGFSAGGLIPGGQLMFTTDVENYPGFPEKVSGQELMQRFRDQAERQGTEIVTADVTRVDFSERPFKVWVEETLYLAASAVIVATGARANYLGLPSEEALKNKGVSACAVCDGALFRGEDVVVVGGGDTAMEEATYLSGLCRSVTLIHRRDEFRASKSDDQAHGGEPEDQDPLQRRRGGGPRPEGGPGHGRRRQEPEDGRQAHRALRRDVRRDRPHADDRALRGPARDAPERLPEDGARLDAHERDRRLRRGRRAGLDLPPGRHGRGHGLHGGAGRRALAVGGGRALTEGAAPHDDPRAELAELAAAVRAYVEQQVDTGAAGLPVETSPAALLDLLGDGGAGPRCAPARAPAARPPRG